MDPILENLKSLIADVTGHDPTEIELLTTLANLGLDSLDKTQLILDCEDAFEVTIADVDDADIHTVAGLYDAILRASGTTID